MKMQLLLTLATALLLAGTSQAQYIDGSANVNPTVPTPGVGGPGLFYQGGSSFKLYGTDYLESSTGDLAGNPGSFVFSYAGVVSGLSSSPTPEDIPDFVSLYPQLGGAPARFEFTLTSITETNSQTGAFTGSGFLVDTTGALLDTPATLNLQFYSYTMSGQSLYDYSLQTDAAPEPSSWALGALGCGVVVLLRLGSRRKAKY